MLPTRLTRFAIVTLALVAIACGDLSRKANYSNALQSFSLFALTGAPVNTPTAIELLGGTTTADGSYRFDVALDLDSLGQTRVYPVRTIAGALSTLRGERSRVGLQVVPGTFDALTEAPATGYDTLGFKVIRANDVLAIEVQDLTTCIYSTRGYFIYGKLTVDSVRTADRRIFGRIVVDRNCGFRGLTPDVVPTN